MFKQKESEIKYSNSKIMKVLRSNLAGWLLLFPSVLLFIFIIWRPILIGIFYSFFKLRGFTPVEFTGIENYKYVLTDSNFMQTLFNTVKYVIWSVIIGFPLPFVCAVLTNEFVKGQGFFKITTYLPVVIPSIAVAMIWKMVYGESSGGLINMLLYYFGLGPMQFLSNKNLVIPLIIAAMSWSGFGTTFLVYMAYLQGVKQELYEAARIDGAGFWARIRIVLFPHMRGILLLMLVRQVIGIFQVTEQPLVMTGGGPNGASMSLGLTNFYYAFKYNQLEKSLALGVITFLILIVLTFVYFGLDKNTD